MFLFSQIPLYLVALLSLALDINLLEPSLLKPQASSLALALDIN